MNLNQNFPPPSLPFLDENGFLAQPWFRLLLALWNRTGGAQGIDFELAELAPLIPQPNDQVRLLTDLLQTALFAASNKDSEIASLRSDMEALKAQVATMQKPSFRQEIDALSVLTRKPPVPAPLDPYPYLRR